MKKTTLIALLLTAMAVSCGKNKQEANEIQPPSFPYQSYLDAMGEEDLFPTIGDDGNGFAPISNKIRYAEMPDSLTLSHFADSLLQLYNTSIALNAISYDLSTAERYVDEEQFRVMHTNAIDSINLKGIDDSKIKELIFEAGKQLADLIRAGEYPNQQSSEPLIELNASMREFCNSLFEGHNTDGNFDPSTVIANYDELHNKAMCDSPDFAHELMVQLREETDFEKRCVLAREFAYANYSSDKRNDKALVALIDPLLKANKYSPLLRELWLMWRTALQKEIFGGPSNDSAMYNTFYNDVRNQIALVYIAHLKTHPNDGIAFKEFYLLATESNIVRDSSCYFGNNSNLDEINLYDPEE